MTCACETDDKGQVINACGAHMNWLRYVIDNNHWHEKEKDLEKAKKDLDFQTKRANTFEKLLIEKANPKE